MQALAILPLFPFLLLAWSLATPVEATESIVAEGIVSAPVAQLQKRFQ